MAAATAMVMENLAANRNHDSFLEVSSSCRSAPVVGFD
jgi:hypothetical protein